MSPVCQLEMTLPGFPGGVWGDGSTDERWGVVAAEVLRDLDQRRLTAAAAAQLLGLERRQVYRLLKAYRTRWADWLDLEAARPLEQPAQARGGSQRSVVGDSRALLGFRPDPGGREAARSAPDHARPRDATVMDDRGWALGDRKQRRK